MKKYLLIVQRHKASLGTRFVNYLIDSVALMLVQIILAFISFLIYSYTSISFFYFFNNGNFLWDVFLGAVVSFIYYFLWEYYSNGKTPGKYITGSSDKHRRQKAYPLADFIKKFVQDNSFRSFYFFRYRRMARQHV